MGVRHYPRNRDLRVLAATGHRGALVPGQRGVGKKYAFRESYLPDESRERFMRIQNEVLEKAENIGWSPGMRGGD